MVFNGWAYDEGFLSKCGTGGISTLEVSRRMGEKKTNGVSIGGRIAQNDNLSEEGDEA